MFHTAPIWSNLALSTNLFRDLLHDTFNCCSIPSVLTNYKHPMKLKLTNTILGGFVIAALATSTAQANLLISYNGNSLGLFGDNGSLIQNYATNLVSPRGVTTDSSGNVYVADDLTVKMYNIATGAFIRNVVDNAAYLPGGLAFNPSNPGEILHFADYSGANSQLVRWDTSATNVAVVFDTQGAGYGGGLFYTPAIAGVTNAGILASNPNATGVVQGFNPTTLAYVGDARNNLGTAGGITGTASELYYVSSSGGYVQTQTTATNVITGLSNPLGITSNGTDFFVANQGTNQILQYTTSGSFVNSFAVTNPNMVAYTAVPEPSTFVMLAVVGLFGFITVLRRKQVKV